MVDNVLVAPRSVAQLTYSLIYLKRKAHTVDWTYLDRLCRLSGLGTLGRDMAQYLSKGRGQLSQFPSDEEFAEKMALYGDSRD